MHTSLRDRLSPQDKVFGCRARDLSAVRLMLAPQLPDNSVSLRVPSLSGGSYARVAELGGCGTGNLSGEREISSRANCGTSSLTPTKHSRVHHGIRMQWTLPGSRQRRGQLYTRCMIDGRPRGDERERIAPSAVTRVTGSEAIPRGQLEARRERP